MFNFKKKKSLLEVGEVQKKKFTQKISFDFVANLPIIEVEIAKKSYRFLFDTGALSVVPSRLVRELSLELLQEIEINDSQEKYSSAHLYTLPSLEVGELEFCDFVVVASDFSKELPLSCLGFDGIFGYNFLNSLVVSIDYTNQEITLSDTLPSVKNYVKMPLVFDGASGAKFEINLPFRNVLFGIDTGKNDAISLSVLDESGAFSKKDYQYKETRGLFMSSFNATQEYLKERSFLVKDFSITKSIRVKKFPISLSDTSHSLVGNDFLKNFDIVLDFRKKQLYLRKLHETIEKEFGDSFGFFMYWSEQEKLYISALATGSVAHKAGVEIGDKVLAINELECYDFTKEDYCKMFLALNGSLASYENKSQVELTIKRGTLIKRVLLKKISLL
ncbi:MAG: aspartyl protease family protein [Campylobacterota bacterium]|nr:aspartyl protease family protein [Campylobacterota bacterium]